MRIPKHVAIIMDGNGRWAQRRRRPRVYGHIRGASRIREVVTEADRLGIRALTLFAFSTENWSRPESELGVLWKLLKRYLTKEVDELDRKNIRFRAIGELERLPADLRELIQAVTDRLSRNTGLHLSLALSYGSRRELTEAARRFAEDCVAGRTQPSNLDEQRLSGYCWTAPLGDLAEVDLVIRTSGEKRVSNFLLWQAAYAEFVFLDLCWPDFGAGQLRAAVEEYAGRERRFGGISAVV